MPMTPPPAHRAEGGVFNAVGLTWETDTTPYQSGPVLVGAKLNAVGEVPPGEGGVGCWREDLVLVLCLMMNLPSTTEAISAFAG